MSRSASQGELATLCNGLGIAAARAVEGTWSINDFNEFVAMQCAEISRLYTEISSSKGPKAARKPTKEAIVAVEIFLKPDWHAIRQAQDLARSALKTIVDGPVW